METKIVLLGLAGGLLPDAIRLLKAKESGDYTAPQYIRQPMFLVLLIIQLLIALLAISIFDVKDKLQAVIYGYGAPQIIISTVTGFINKINSPGSGNKNKDLGDDSTPQPTKFKEMARRFY